MDIIANYIYYIANTLFSLIIPVALLGCTISFVTTRLPGTDAKAASMMRKVFWSCLCAIIIACGIRAIFGIAQNFGNKMTDAINEADNLI